MASIHALMHCSSSIITDRHASHINESGTKLAHSGGQVSELRLRLSTAEAGRAEAAGEAAQLRTRNAMQAQERAAQVVALIELRAQLAARDDKVCQSLSQLITCAAVFHP